jgi:hypothetical protein
VTLVLGMSKPEGIYLSVDHRLSLNGVPTDDDAVKFLNVRYPPTRTGPQALFAYVGASQVRRGIPTEVWLRNTIQLGPHEFNASMANLFRRVGLDAHRRQILIINALVMCQGLRYFVGISNMKPLGGTTWEFDRKIEKISEEYVFANGSAAHWALSGEASILSAQLKVAPRDPWSHMGLLARSNRRLAKLDKQRVSAHCHVSFVNADENGHPRAGAFLTDGEPGLLVIPELSVGVELSSATEYVNRSIASWNRLSPSVFDPKEIQRSLARRLNRA